MKVIVYCPFGYTQDSGGILACHKLADSLSKIEGVESYIFTPQKTPLYGGTQLWSNEYNQHGLTSDNTIVIYPEVIPGNPLNAKHVVRWVLNTPGTIGGDESTWKDTDRIFLYDSFFKVQNTERVVGKLSQIEPFLDIFKNNKGDRSGGVCHLVRKGNYKSQTWHPPHSISIDTFSKSLEKQAEIFNHCHTFISYDDHSFTTTQAALCGCLVIVVPDYSKMSEERWYKSLPTHKYGQSYGLEGVFHAISSQSLVREMVEREVKKCDVEVQELVNFCREWIK